MNQVTKLNNAGAALAHMAEPRGQNGNVVQLPPPRSAYDAARLRQAASHRDECADCIQMAVASLLALAAMLFASALLRQAGINGEIAHYLLAGLGFLATASGFAALLAVGLALVHFIQFRQF